MVTETRTTHTPGPFTLGEPIDLSPTDRESYEVWEVRPLTTPTGEIVALLPDADANPFDAALFKVAPALLAALEGLVAHSPRCVGAGCFNAWHDRAQAAIAAARGTEQ